MDPTFEPVQLFSCSSAVKRILTSSVSVQDITVPIPMSTTFLFLKLSWPSLLLHLYHRSGLTTWCSEEQSSLGYPLLWQVSGVWKLLVTPMLTITDSRVGPLLLCRQGIRNSWAQKPIHAPGKYSRLHKWQRSCTGTPGYLPLEIFGFHTWN